MAHFIGTPRLEKVKKVYHLLRNGVFAQDHTGFWLHAIADDRDMLHRRSRLLHAEDAQDGALSMQHLTAEVSDKYASSRYTHATEKAIAV